MNNLELLHTLFFFGGIVAGALTVGFLCGTNDQIEDLQKQGFSLVRHEVSDDWQLIDFLEQSEYSLFFNDQVEGGMWGVLDEDNKLLAAGMSIRSAIKRAIEKNIDDTPGSIAAALVERPVIPNARVPA